MKAPLALALPVAASLFLSSCADSDSGSDDSADAGTDVNPQIQAVILDTAPEGAIPVSEARKTAKPGDTVTISGKVAGAMNPFTEGYATLILSDRTLETCDLIPGDECPTPWDACCADPEHIKAVRLTLQVVGEDGVPIAQTLKGVAGMAELTPLIATGTVAKESTEENLIVNVTGLFAESS